MTCSLLSILIAGFESCDIGRLGLGFAASFFVFHKSLMQCVVYYCSHETRNLVLKSGSSCQAISSPTFHPHARP